MPPEYPPVSRLEAALDLLFPPVCVGCRRVGRWICQGCWLQAPWIDDARCQVCGKRSIHPVCFRCSGNGRPLARIAGLLEYRDIGEGAVQALKFDGRHAIAAPLGRLLANLMDEVEAPIVTHVPLHPSRRRERGFDQSSKLARAAANAARLEYHGRLLRRTVKTRQQAMLSRKERAANVAGAFVATSSVPSDTVLLIDDVSTSGATLSAAARALVDAGASEVVGVVVAHTP